MKTTGLDSGIKNERLFAAAVEELYQCGYLVADIKTGGRPEQVAPTVYKAVPGSIGWEGVARELASLLPGQVRPSMSNEKTGCGWQNGGRGAPHGVLISPVLYPSVIEAQGMVLRLLPDAPLKWSIGALARLLLLHVGPPQAEGTRQVFNPDTKALEWKPGQADQFLEGIEYGYHECTPGKYADCEYWDVSAYYYSMLSRLKSLRILVSAEGFTWLPMTPDERSRWGEVLELVKGNKALRNTLAGVCSGSYKKSVAFCRDKTIPVAKGDPYPVKKIWTPGAAGPFRAAGLLLVRTGYELTQQECRQNPTIYSTIDSVIVKPGGTPGAIWRERGLVVELKAAGDAEICCRGSYKIGRRSTSNYREGFRHYEGTPPQAVPKTLYNGWLR